MNRMALRTVTYIVNYSETPEVFQLYNTTPVNFPNPSSTPTNNVLVSFFPSAQRLQPGQLFVCDCDR